MLRLNDFAEFFRDLQGLVSEPVRATIVRRFCTLIAGRLRQLNNDEELKRWLNGGYARFIVESEIKDADQVVPDSLDVEASELSRFCNRWLTITDFRTSANSDWRPITPEMNSIRVTMVKELRQLAQDKFKQGEFTQDIEN